ncbi:hypothetical protein DAPPUDRAFT_247985 [Daphnia pulex]|uniref:Uncharacterized protein n=1 Tax=Daphnia pulex TaxID=6669 RepID=E9GTG8_DAPPU|nr:hypothetical protein DAPPUDRAFT_247985 [Daphnia pulex]|eukprot:EFX77218.1 hypothetical protein DAPPUDRAFT_247985 [Daphnia pulex]
MSNRAYTYAHMNNTWEELGGTSFKCRGYGCARSSSTKSRASNKRKQLVEMTKHFDFPFDHILNESRNFDQHRGQVKCCNETPVRIRGFYILACNHYAGVGARITFNRTIGAILGTHPAAVAANRRGKKVLRYSAQPLCAELREAQKRYLYDWNSVGLAAPDSLAGNCIK